jgi:hypothetical protein
MYARDNASSLSGWFALVVLMSLGGAASAHHSTAMFDYSKTQTLSGQVRQFQWGNPHCYIQILVPDDQGGATEWSIEGGTPSSMTRMGWSPDSLKPGDKVTLAIAPMRDGSKAGTVKTATLADGKVLNGMAAVLSSAPAGQAPPALQLPSLEHVTPK